MLNATTNVARNTPKLLHDHKSLQDIIVILGVDELSEKDKLTVARDCKVHRFLSQPFFVAEIFTGTPRMWVDLETTFSDFDEVLSENCDDAPEAAFYIVGSLMDVNTHRYLCSFIGLEPERQAVEEVKGHTEELAILWRWEIARHLESPENVGVSGWRDGHKRIRRLWICTSSVFDAGLVRTDEKS